MDNDASSIGLHQKRFVLREFCKLSTPLHPGITPSMETFEMLLVCTGTKFVNRENFIKVLWRCNDFTWRRKTLLRHLFHGTGSVPMDVGHLPLLARLSGSLCTRTCVIRMFLRTVTGSHRRRFYLRST